MKWPEDYDMYVDWICKDCAGLRGGLLKHADSTTWHEGRCDLCGDNKAITQPRDFGLRNLGKPLPPEGYSGPDKDTIPAK